MTNDEEQLTCPDERLAFPLTFRPVFKPRRIQVGLRPHNFDAANNGTAVDPQAAKSVISARSVGSVEL
jgi:hypothetical protein